MKRIIFIQYTNPAAYPPLQHSSRMLARAGWEVLFLGVRAIGAEALRFPRHEGIKVRQISFSPRGWKQKVHYLRYSLWVIFWTLRWRPRFIYASDPLSCPVALLLSFLPYMKIIYHEHDSPTLEPRTNSPERVAGSRAADLEPENQRSEISVRRPQGSRFMEHVFRARRRLAGRARLCVLPNEERAEGFAVDLGISAARWKEANFVVWNCPSQEEVSAPRPAHGGGDLWVVYHGSIVPSRLPLALLDALAALPRTIKLRIVGYETVGHRGYVEELRAHAKRLNIDERVEFLGTVPQRSDLLHWCRKSDVGVAFVPRKSADINQQHMLGASNKPFDYLSCGLALLVSDLPEWRQTYVDLGYGLGCDPGDAKSIAAALRWFVDHPGEMRAMGERGRRRIAKEWNYEAQFAPVFGRMTREQN